MLVKEMGNCSGAERKGQARSYIAEASPVWKEYRAGKHFQKSILILSVEAIERLITSNDAFLSLVTVH